MAIQHIPQPSNTSQVCSLLPHLQNIHVAESIDGDGATKKISKTKGLIWILFGNQYTLNINSDLAVKVGQKLKIDILGKMHEATILEESPYDSENKLLRA